MFFKEDTFRDRLADDLGYWVLLTLAALLPLAVYGVGEVPIVMTKIFVGGVLVLIAGILFAVARMQQQELAIHKSLVLATAWGLPVAYLLSTLFASDVSISFYGKQLTMDSAAFLLLCALTLTLTSLMLTDAKRTLGLYLAMLGSAAVLTLFEMLVFFARDTVAATGIVLPSLSLFGTLNDLAVFFGLIMLFTLLSLMLLPVSTAVRGVLWGVLGAASFFLAAVNLTALWWIVGGFVLAMFVYSQFGRFMDDGAKKTISFAPLAALLLCAFFLFGSESATSTVATWANVGELDVRPSWSTTIQLGNQALENHMLFGVGPDTFTEQWSRYMPADISQSIFWRADFAYGIGFIPTTVIATGLLGLLAWLTFFGVFVWNGAKAFMATRKVSRGDVIHFLRVTSFVGALYLWIIAIIQVPSPALVLYAFVLTGVFIAARSWGDDATRQVRIAFKENPRAGFLTTLTLTFVILASIGGMYSITMRHSAEAAYQKAVKTANTEGNIEMTEQFLQKAIARHPVDAYYRLLSSVDVVRIQQLLARNEPPEVIRPEFQALLSRTIGNAQQASIVGKHNYSNWENLGNLYQGIVPLGIEGAAESATASFDQALALRPNSPHIYLAKAALERQQGANDKAHEYVEKAIALRNQYTDAIFLLAQMQLEADDVEQALRSVEGVTQFEPNNPVAWFQLGLLRYGSNDFTGAAYALERAVGLNTQYANARYFLALTYWRLGSRELAVRQLEEIRVTNPDNVEIPTMIENLSAGRDPYDAGTTPSEDISTREGLPLENADQNDAAVASTTESDLAE